MSSEQIPGRSEKPEPAARKLGRGQYSLLEAAEEEPDDTYKEMAEFLSDKFTMDQLGMLQEMLEKMKVGGRSSLASPGTKKKSLGKKRERGERGGMREREACHDQN